MKKLMIPLTLCLAAIFMAVSCKDPEPTPDDPDIVDTTDTDLGFTKPTCEAFVHDIVDGGFENCWYKQEMSNEIYVEYQSSVFYSLNSLHALMDNPSMMLTSSPITAYRDKTDPHSGKSCMKLVTGQLTDGNGQLLIPGAMAPLDENFVYQFLHPDVYPEGINVKKAYTDKPTAIKGFYKYLPVNGDEGSICVELFNGSEKIARGYQRFGSDVSQWTSFNIPIDYTINGGSLSTAQPTHISIIVSSSADYNFADLTNCQGQVGSTLWLDDISFEF